MIAEFLNHTCTIQRSANAQPLGLALALTQRPRDALGEVVISYSELATDVPCYLSERRETRPSPGVGQSLTVSWFGLYLEPGQNINEDDRIVDIYDGSTTDQRIFRVTQVLRRRIPLEGLGLHHITAVLELVN